VWHEHDARPAIRGALDVPRFDSRRALAGNVAKRELEQPERPQGDPRPREPLFAGSRRTRLDSFRPIGDIDHPRRQLEEAPPHLLKQLGFRVRPEARERSGAIAKASQTLLEQGRRGLPRRIRIGTGGGGPGWAGI
jgi:hypothetical protein